MFTFLQTKIGRLRLLAQLEGLSLLALLFIAVPMKYIWHNPSGTQLVGPIHGVLFVFFVINTLAVGVEQRWVFRRTTWKVLLACMVPFGTFYIDKHLLRKIKPNTES